MRPVFLRKVPLAHKRPQKKPLRGPKALRAPRSARHFLACPAGASALLNFLSQIYPLAHFLMIALLNARDEVYFGSLGSARQQATQQTMQLAPTQQFWLVLATFCDDFWQRLHVT